MKAGLLVLQDFVLGCHSCRTVRSLASCNVSHASLARTAAFLAAECHTNCQAASHPARALFFRQTKLRQLPHTVTVTTISKEAVKFYTPYTVTVTTVQKEAIKFYTEANFKRQPCLLPEWDRHRLPEAVELQPARGHRIHDLEGGAYHHKVDGSPYYKGMVWYIV